MVKVLIQAICLILCLFFNYLRRIFSDAGLMP